MANMDALRNAIIAAGRELGQQYQWHFECGATEPAEDDCFVAVLEKHVTPVIEPFPIFDILPRLWAAGYKTVEQDGEWYLFRKDGEGMLGGKTFRELCVNIVMAGI